MQRSSIESIHILKTTTKLMKAMLLATVVLSVAPTMVIAAEPARLGNIMVKGELQERSLQDSQTSAVVYSGVNLDQSTDLDLHDIIGRTPGIHTIGTDKGISIRGINEVRVSVDGQFAPNARANLYGAYSTWDMERVEILRGAQSTQSGRNALAGSVNLKTMNPTFNQEGKVRLDIGSKNTKQIAVE